MSYVLYCLFWISDQEVDKESFILLDDHAIASLIPKIGHRVKFQKQHKELVSKMQ